MIQVHEEEKFYNSIIAQDDDNDYEENGYVACVIGNWAALAHYGHCSCYGTWTSITGGDYSGRGTMPPEWDWQGTPDELVAMAIAKRCITVPDRTINENDEDYDHLKNVYDQIVEWDKSGRPKREE